MISCPVLQVFANSTHKTASSEHECRTLIKPLGKTRWLNPLNQRLIRVICGPFCGLPNGYMPVGVRGEGVGCGQCRHLPPLLRKQDADSRRNRTLIHADKDRMNINLRHDSAALTTSLRNLWLFSSMMARLGPCCLLLGSKWGVLMHT